MLLAKDYLSLQERLKSSQHVLDEEVKENQRREAVIWKLDTVLRRRKAKLAKIRRELGPVVCYYRGAVHPTVFVTSRSCPLYCLQLLTVTPPVTFRLRFGMTRNL